MHTMTLYQMLILSIIVSVIILSIHARSNVYNQLDFLQINELIDPIDRQNIDYQTIFAFNSDELHPKTSNCEFPFCAQPTVLYNQNVTLTKDRFSPCTLNDIGIYFTPCDTSNNKKHMIQFYKSPAMCDSKKGVSLVEPIVVDCDFKSCSSGQYFNTTSNKCQYCEKGEFNTGGILYFANATSWPAETFKREFNVNGSFRTGTIDEIATNSHTILSLVHNDVINPNTTSFSELTFRIFVSNPPAKLIFEYRVFGGESERQIGESFYRWLVRNTGEIIVRSLDRNSNGKIIFHEISYENSNDWKLKTVDLNERSVYDIMLRFNRQFTRTDSMNGMQVKDLRIEGMPEKITSCNKCSPGTYTSEDGSSTCKMCGPNTFSSNEGSSSCEPCPPGLISFEGSSECRPGNVPCTDKDYYAIEIENSCFDEKDNWNSEGKRKFKYEWIQPKICQENVTGSVSLPSIEEVHCPTQILQCHNIGEVIQKSREDIHCSYCTDKKVPNNDHTDCVQCPNDSFPVNQTLIVSNFVSQIKLLQNYSTNCYPESQCQSNGFRGTKDYLDSGVGNGRSVSQFSFVVDSSHYFSGNIIINYTMNCSPGKAKASFFVDNTLHHLAECSGCESKEVSSILIALRPAHISNVRVEYNSLETQYSNKCGFIKIHSIEMKGVGQGGYTSCESCNSGLELAEVDGSKVCVKCEPGYYSIKGGRCTKCPSGTYTPDFGTSQCLKCPEMMSSSEGSHYCDFVKNPMEIQLTDGNEPLKYNWTGVVKSSLLSKKQPIISDGGISNNNIIIAIPFENQTEDSSFKTKCPPHSLACIELEINGYMEIFSLADAIELVSETSITRDIIQEYQKNRKYNEDGGLDVSGAPEDTRTDFEVNTSEVIIEKKTVRLYKENNRFCSGARSQVDLNFLCTNHDIPIINARQIGNCTFELDVKSIESCRMCYLSEYTLIKRTECLGNRLEKHWIVREDAPLCNSRSYPPESTWEFCVKENVLYLAWLLPTILLIAICCVTVCCCLGSMALYKRVRTLKDENERLSLIRHEGMELGERRDVGMDATDP